LLLTGASWFVLGLFYGIGYCPLTDWHWQVLSELGTYPTENSYVQYFFRRTLNMKISVEFADGLTVMAFFLALCCSLIVNFRSIFKKKT
jgi:hypothetical protein